VIILDGARICHRRRGSDSIFCLAIGQEFKLTKVLVDAAGSARDAVSPSQQRRLGFECLNFELRRPRRKPPTRKLMSAGNLNHTDFGSRHFLPTSCAQTNP